MFELQRCKSFKHSLQNVVQYTVYKNFAICREHNWELSMWFPEEQIHNKPDIYTKTKEFGIETHNLCVDFKSAYDTIKRELLYSAMSEFNIPNKLMTYTDDYEKYKKSG